MATGHVSNKECYGTRFVRANRNDVRLYGSDVPLFPETVQLDVTQRCNLRCAMCPTGARIAKGVCMETAPALRLIEEAATLGACNLGLYMTGEPLLHPEIISLAARGKQNGYYVYLTTNGLVLTESLADRLIEVGVDSVKFSVDAANAEDYRAVRRGGDFDLLLRNMEMLRSKVERASAPLLISAGFVVMAANFNEEKKRLFRERFAGVAHSTWFTFMNTLGGRQDLPGKSQEQTVVEMACKTLESERTVCPQLWNRLVVTADMRLVACCADFNGEMVYSEHATGNLEQEWNNETIRRWRRGFLEGYPPSAMCKLCTAWNMDVKHTVELNK